MIKTRIFIGLIVLTISSSAQADETTNSLTITIPPVPKVNVTVPKALELKINSESTVEGVNRTIQFSKRVPANYQTSAERYGKGGAGSSLAHIKIEVGAVEKGRISAYLRADLIDVKKAEEKLKNAGFEVVATVPLNKSGLTSIVFTNSELKKLAAKKERGYLGTLRLLVDPQNKQISITNPLYLSKAFLGNEFKEETPKKLLSSLVKEFKSVKNSLDKLKFQLLPSYQFMEGMPHFKDTMRVGRGKDLKEKVKKSDKIAYIIELPNGAILAGVKLSKKTMVFPDKIGTNNAGLLPYPLLIEDGKAKILDPKYYLALMYPQLSMEGFMSIAMIPSSIRRDCKKIFR